MNYFLILLLILMNCDNTSEEKVQNMDNSINEIYEYRILEAGSIRPTGWIREQLHRDLTQGYIGAFDHVHPTVTHELFVQQERKSKRKFSMRKEWWSGEHEGYWKDAVIRMAFLTEDAGFKARAGKWMEDILTASKKHDGYIGIYRDGEKPGSRFNHIRGNGELWVTSRILMAMLAYYEYTDNAEVLEAAEKAAQLIMKAYDDENYFATTSRGGGVSHGIGFFENLEWLYRITGKEQYLEFAEKLYNHFNSTEVRDDDLQTQQLLKEDELFEKHGAHIAEGLFVPRMIASISGDKQKKKAAENVLEKLDQQTTPSGAMRADEWIKGRKGTADERYEYCGIAEMISPMNKMVEFSGNLTLADRIETMSFNAGQGARLPVLKALSYFTKDNRIKINHREIVRRETYDAAHFAAACCVLNGGRLMPYFVEGMWMKPAETEGLLALLYGPNTLKTDVKGVPVTIEEKTHYPFSDTVKFTVRPGSPVDFPLILRKPFGCKETKIRLPDGAISEERDDRIIVRHTWEEGDQVELVFGFEIKKIPQPASGSVEGKGVYIQRGPLVFSLPFEHEIKPVKEHRNSGYYRYRIKAGEKEAWNYNLDMDGPFSIQHLETANMNTPWDEPVIKIEAQLTGEDGKKRPAKLVPMGNTVFRRVTFSINQ